MNKWWKIGCLVAAAILVLSLVIVAAVVIFSNLHSQPNNPAPASFDQVRSMQAELITPNEGEQWPVNAFVPVRAVGKSEDRVIALELWVDGKLFGARDGLNEHEFSTATGEWYWQPATRGSHSLFVRGVDSNGQTSYSKIVNVFAVEAEGSRERGTPVEGQSLAQIAEEKGVGVDVLQENNPGLDPELPLIPGQDIFIPVPPDPIKDVEVVSIEPYLPPTTESTQGGNDWIQHIPVIGELIQGNTSPSDSSLPAAPTLIKAELQNGCDAYLEFKDNSGNEDGNRIYRAVPGQTSFSKVADLPPYITKTIIHLDPKLNIKGGWTYYAAAYNANGEAKSLPVSIDLTDPNCYQANPPLNPEQVRMR